MISELGVYAYNHPNILRRRNISKVYLDAISFMIIHKVNQQLFSSEHDQKDLAELCGLYSVWQELNYTERYSDAQFSYEIRKCLLAEDVLSAYMKKQFDRKHYEKGLNQAYRVFYSLSLNERDKLSLEMAKGDPYVLLIDNDERQKIRLIILEIRLNLFFINCKTYVHQSWCLCYLKPNYSSQKGYFQSVFHGNVKYNCS